ncbi:MAG: hypothetical protein AB7P99_00310 [Vicinamibacterales bacterium]
MRKQTQRHAAAALVAAALLAPTTEPTLRHASARQTRQAAKAGASRRGRPKKFGRPSRAVTLTLPTDVIAALNAVDTDLSRAIVRVAESLPPGAKRGPAELAPYGNRAIITVPNSRSLKERTGIELVPLSDGRALISFDQRLTVSQIELRLLDALADGTLEASERDVFEALARILREARQAPDVELRERQIIVLHRTPGSRA